MKNTKKLLSVAVGVVVVAGLLWLVAGGPGNGIMGVSPSPSGSQAPIVTSGMGAKPGSAMPKSYSDAIKRYEGNRFQFDQYCQTDPNSSSYKNGATVMLDNRSGDARTISIGGVKYNLAGYGWRIVTLSSSKLPTTLYINCGTAVNVAKIQLYK